MKVGHIIKKKIACTVVKRTINMRQQALGDDYKTAEKGSKGQGGKNVFTPQVDLFMLQEFTPSFKHAFARLDCDILADLDKSKCLTIWPLELYVSLALNICSYFISSISTNQTM